MTSAEASLHTGEGSLTFKKGARKRRKRKKRKRKMMMEVEEIQRDIKIDSVEEQRLKLIDRITY